MSEHSFKRDDYFALHVTMPSGFEFKIGARGFNLKSWLAFEEKLESTVVVEQISADMYNHIIFGDPLDPLGELLHGSDDQGQTERTNPPKGNSRKAKSESSKGTGNTRKRATQTSKEKPSVVRKSPVRNVRKPKKDVQGTNDSGTKTATRSRKPKGSTQ